MLIALQGAFTSVSVCGPAGVTATELLTLSKETPRESAMWRFAQHALSALERETSGQLARLPLQSAL